MKSILSVPSWVIPGTYAENLRFLEKQNEVKGVELLFFIYDNEVKTQLDSEWDEIRDYSKRFIYTAHLPENLIPAHGELIARLAPLVRHFIIHPFKTIPEAEASLLGEWSKQYGVKFLAENTNPGLLESLLPHLNLCPETAGLCMDTGHLLMEEKSPAEFYKKHKTHICEIHLHAVDREQTVIDGRLADHRRLRPDESWLHELLPLLDDYSGVINLEIFSWEEAGAGIEVLKKYFKNPIDK